jgi:hypothetical protein
MTETDFTRPWSEKSEKYFRDIEDAQAGRNVYIPKNARALMIAKQQSTRIILIGVVLLSVLWVVPAVLVHDVIELVRRSLKDEPLDKDNADVVIDCSRA